MAKVTKKKAAKKAAKAKAPRATLPQKNGVHRPGADTITGKVWDIADKLSAKAGTAAERADVIAACVKAKIPAATAATQFQNWRVFFGVKRKPSAGRKPAAKSAKPAKKAAKKAAKKTAKKAAMKKATPAKAAPKKPKSKPAKSAPAETASTAAPAAATSGAVPPPPGA